MKARAEKAEAELNTFYDEGCWRNRAVSAEARVAELENERADHLAVLDRHALIPECAEEHCKSHEAREKEEAR